MGHGQCGAVGGPYPHEGPPDDLRTGDAGTEGRSDTGIGLGPVGRRELHPRGLPVVRVLAGQGDGPVLGQRIVVAPVATSSGLLVTSALTWQVEERETYDRDQEVAGECVVSDVVALDAAVGGLCEGCRAERMAGT